MKYSTRIAALALLLILALGLCPVWQGAARGEAAAALDEAYAYPESWAFYAVGEDRYADIFIVAPTVDNRDEYNMTFDDDNLFRFKRALNMQKGLYEDSLRMFAPYYAQMSFKAFELPKAEFRPYKEIAYEDVSEAFRYYLEHENQGRPSCCSAIPRARTTYFNC